MTARSEPDRLVVPVPLAERSYEIHVVSGDPDRFGPFVAAALGGRLGRGALIVSDEQTRRLAAPYQAALERLGLETGTAVVPAGEASKSIERAVDLIDLLIDRRADRRGLVVAVGGGVVGDLAGFVAATFARGVPLVMVPTTLLAQVDSSVGGKVAVNRPKAKNIVGAFHQPAGVWIDTQTLESLPIRELRCGLAEVIKYGVILDASFLDGLERDLEALLEREAEPTRRVVAHCCRLKAGVVAEDEREQTGRRAVLNFGHTIGHAIEAVAGYAGDFRHGEAVAVGMIAEARLAERLGWIGPEATDRLRSLIDRAGLPTRAPGLDPAALLRAMRLDKKNQAGRIRFVLPRAWGAVELTDAPSETDLNATLAEMVG